MRPLFLSLFSSLIFISCNKDKDQTPVANGRWDVSHCADPKILIVFPGYDSTEIDTVIARRYEIN